jgi:hypothetical protein
MRGSCLAVGHGRSLRDSPHPNPLPPGEGEKWRPRESRPGPGSLGLLEVSRLPVATRPPQPKVARGGLRRRRSDVLSRRRRRRMRPGIALVTPPCIRPGRSQRRLTPFFSSLGARRGYDPDRRLRHLPSLPLGRDGEKLDRRRDRSRRRGRDLPFEAASAACRHCFSGVASAVTFGNRMREPGRVSLEKR